jgi:hypothetical protein
LVALRYIPGAVVSSIIVFSIAVLIVGTIVLWYFLSFYIASLVLKSCLVGVYIPFSIIQMTLERYNIPYPRI